MWLFHRDEASGSGESRTRPRWVRSEGAADPRADPSGSSRSPAPPRAGAARSASRAPFSTSAPVPDHTCPPAKAGRRRLSQQAGRARFRLEGSSRGPQRSCTEAAGSCRGFPGPLLGGEPGNLPCGAGPPRSPQLLRAPRRPRPANRPEKAPASLTTKSPICAPCSPPGASTCLASWEALAALTHDDKGRECAHRAGSQELAARPAARPVLSVSSSFPFGFSSENNSSPGKRCDCPPALGLRSRRRWGNPGKAGRAPHVRVALAGPRGASGSPAPSGSCGPPVGECLGRSSRTRRASGPQAAPAPR